MAENDVKILDESIFNLSTIKIILGDTDQAIEALEYLLLREDLSSNEKADLYCNLSSAYSHNGDFIKAKQYALTSIQMVPSHLKSLNILGSIHNRLNEYDHAVEIFGLAVNYYDDAITSRLGLADALHGSGRTSAAVTELRRANALDVGNPGRTAFKHLCFMLRKNGHEGEAVALEVQREIEDADRVRKRLLALAKSS